MGRFSAIIAATMAIAGYPLKLVDEALTITPRPAEPKPKTGVVGKVLGFTIRPPVEIKQAPRAGAKKRKLTQADRDALAKAEAKRARKAKRGGVAR
jgi:hypothetical protein